MGYIRVDWSQSQYIMELTEEEIEELGIECGEQCDYFVPEESLDEVRQLTGLWI